MRAQFLDNVSDLVNRLRIVHPAPRRPAPYTRAICASPGLAVIGIVDGSGKVVRQPLDVIASGQHPHRFSYQSEGIGIAVRQRLEAVSYTHLPSPRDS